VGLGIVAALAAWILVASARSGGSPGRHVSVAAAVAVAYAVGRLIAARWPTIPAVVVVVLVAGLVLGAWTEITSGSPLAGPLGYQNANGALAVQGFVAAAILAGAVMRTPARVSAGAAAALFAVVPFVTGSAAAALTSVVVLIVAAIAIGGAWRPWMTLGLVTAELTVLVTTVVLGATYTPHADEPLGLVAEVLTPTRLALWRDAVELTATHPLAGVGVGRFAEASPVAAAEPDVRHAHEEYLELTAETGIGGGLLLVTLVVWTTIRAGARRGGGAIAAAGVAALGIHASVDYVLQFPLVPITAALLAGAGTTIGLRAWTSWSWARAAATDETAEVPETMERNR
jgi:O-antigen ligase